MRPRASVARPMASRPRPSVLGRRPVDTSTRSQRIVSLPSTSTSGRRFFTATPVTRAPSVKLRSCRFSRRCASRAISASMPGRMRSRYSSTVTLLPSRAQTEPSSRPMAPAPITTRCPGTSLHASASVLPPTRSPSSSTFGRVPTRLPVAMMILLAAIVSSPALEVTATVPGPAKRAVPAYRVTPARLNSAAMPSVRPVTTSSLRAIMAARSSVTLPSLTPWTSRPSLARAKCRLDSSRALLGTQPTRRQVPPRRSSFSMQATSRPSCAARRAAT